MTRRIWIAALPIVLVACTTETGNDAGANDVAPTASGNVANDAGAVDQAAGPMADGSVVATASLRDAAGADRGRVEVREAARGLSYTISAEGLPAGAHGAHVHMVGKCEGPKFETAGGHWNPTSKQHGRENPQGAHSGDLPNIDIGADGRGTLTFTTPEATLAGLFDGDGSAFMIHARPDDYKTDPSGNSGDRIACGVIERS